MKNTLLIIFIHGFKGTDYTFHEFPKDLRNSLAHRLPKINIVVVQYPRYETRGDLRDCVASCKEWLQNKVIDLEVASHTPSPTIDPSVHVILCGHSMGGIVAAETLLSIARDEPVPTSSATSSANSTTGYTDRAHGFSSSKPINLDVPAQDERPSPTPPPPSETTRLFFPHVQAVLAFDTPYLGISPGVLAHGAEEQAMSAYKAFDSASKLFGWNSPKSTTPPPVSGAASKGTGGGWNRFAMYGGAAAAIAGVAGAAYLNRNQINQGLSWAGSHLEFVGCLARGAELQRRVEKVVELTKTHGVGFTNFYGALDEKISSKTVYAGAFIGQDRTFCVVPKQARQANSPTGTKRNQSFAAEQSVPPPSKRQESRGAAAAAAAASANVAPEMDQGEEVHQFAEDTTRSKGRWVKCVNPSATDEIVAHTSLFSPEQNPHYQSMLSQVNDQIVEWIDAAWYEGSVDEREEPPPPRRTEESTSEDAGADTT